MSIETYWRWQRPAYRPGWHLMAHTKRGKDVCRYFHPRGDNDK